MDGIERYLITDRLLLRPWETADMYDLYEVAKDEEVSVKAGWLAHTSPQYSAKIIEDRHLSENVAVVTSEFHLARACLYAKRNGLHPSPVRAATPWYCLPAYVLREVYAVFDAFVIHRI